MEKLNVIAYKFILLLFTYESIGMIVFSSINFKYPPQFAIINTVVFFLIWWLPNYIYFRKRKALFYTELANPPINPFIQPDKAPDTIIEKLENNLHEESGRQVDAGTEDTVKTEEEKPKNPERFCKHCGGKANLETGCCETCGKRLYYVKKRPKKFCKYCGGQIDNDTKTCTGCCKSYGINYINILKYFVIPLLICVGCVLGYGIGNNIVHNNQAKNEYKVFINNYYTALSNKPITTADEASEAINIMKVYLTGCERMIKDSDYKRKQLHELYSETNFALNNVNKYDIASLRARKNEILSTLKREIEDM